MPLTAAPIVSTAGLNAPVVRRLPNGLTIIAEQMPTEAVNLSLWLKVGSGVETDPINGMAHFLEHMVFKGTPTLAQGEFERLIEQRGAVTNAATSQEYTHYYTTCAPQDFASLAPLQIELVMNPTLNPEAFERERPVILEEIRRAQDSPRRRTFYRSVEMAFERLPYRRPVLGPTAVIEQLSPEQMQQFHAQWYQPANLTAVAVGNLPVEALIQTVADGFDQALHNRQHHGVPSFSGVVPTIAALQPEEPFKTIQRITQVDPSLQQARLVMVWRVPGMVDLADTYALDVITSILGRGRTARLVRDLREARGLVSGIAASNMTYTHQGTFYISAQLPTENLAVVEGAIADHIRDLHQTPVQDRELRRIRTQVANRYIFGSETPSDRAGLYGYYQTLTGNLADAFDYPSHIQGIDADAVQAAAQQYLRPEAYGVVTMLPDKEAVGC